MLFLTSRHHALAFQRVRILLHGSVHLVPPRECGFPGALPWRYVTTSIEEAILAYTLLRTGGIVSSVAAIAWRNLTNPNALTGSHGASGAIYAVTSFFACVAPNATFALFGVIPLPAWAFVSGIFLWDGYNALVPSVSTHPDHPPFSSNLICSTQGGRTDHAGHIGGLLSGIGFFIAKRLRIF